MEQQKKIHNFINVFGLPTKQDMRMYSPQKTKKILKVPKQVVQKWLFVHWVFDFQNDNLHIISK